MTDITQLPYRIELGDGFIFIYYDQVCVDYAINDIWVEVLDALPYVYLAIDLNEPPQFVMVQARDNYFTSDELVEMTALIHREYASALAEADGAS